MLTVIAVAYAASFVVMLIVALTAPSGWQDERGFHFGEPVS